MTTHWQFEVNVYDLANDERLGDDYWAGRETGAIAARDEWKAYIAAWVARFKEAPVWRHAHRASPSQVHGGHVRLDEVIEEMADVAKGDVAHLQACLDAIYDWGDYQHRLFVNAVLAPVEAAS